jgi:T-lymphoma invasion and metastasis-inducing protein 1
MLSRSNSGSSRRSLQMTSREESEKTVKVSLPDNQVLEDKSNMFVIRIQC